METASKTREETHFYRTIGRKPHVRQFEHIKLLIFANRNRCTERNHTYTMCTAEKMACRTTKLCQVACLIRFDHVEHDLWHNYKAKNYITLFGFNEYGPCNSYTNGPLPGTLRSLPNICVSHFNFGSLFFVRFPADSVVYVCECACARVCVRERAGCCSRLLKFLIKIQFRLLYTSTISDFYYALWSEPSRGIFSTDISIFLAFLFNNGEVCTYAFGQVIVIRKTNFRA